MRTIIRLYERYDDAAKVVVDLEAAGISHGDISLITGSDQANNITSDDPDINASSRRGGDRRSHRRGHRRQRRSFGRVGLVGHSRHRAGRRGRLAGRSSYRRRGRGSGRQPSGRADRTGRKRRTCSAACRGHKARRNARNGPRSGGQSRIGREDHGFMGRQTKLTR